MSLTLDTPLSTNGADISTAEEVADVAVEARLALGGTGLPGKLPAPLFSAALSRIRGGAVERAAIVPIGDSTGFDLFAQTYQQLWLAYGFGGYSGKGFTNVIEITMAGGATKSTSNVDYSQWYSSTVFTVGAGASLTWGRHSSFVSRLRFTATIFKVYYRTASGAGTFKVQYQNSAGSWTDVSGYTAVNANAAASLAILTIPVPENAREYVWRVVGVSGTVTICELGVLNASGLVINSINEGGTDIANAMSGFSSTDMAVMLDDFAPALVTVATKDDIGPLTTALPILQGRLDDHNPDLEVIYTGSYGTGIESVNVMVREHAVASGKLFFDYYLTTAAMLEAEYFIDPDLTHATPTYQRVIGNALIKTLGIDGVLGRVPQDVRADSLEARVADLTGQLTALSAAVASLTVGGNGAAAVATLSGSGVGSVAVVASGRSYVAPVASFVGGTGSGATATVQHANGTVTGVTVTAAGTGYNSAPAVVITDSAAVSLTSGNTQGTILTGLNQLVVSGLNAVGASPTASFAATASNSTTLRVVRAATNGVFATFFDSDGVTSNLQLDNNRLLFYNSGTIYSIGSTITFSPGGAQKAQFTSSGLSLLDGSNLVCGLTAGSKIGTTTGQKIGFWNATPVVQQVLATGSTADQIIGLLQTLGLCRQS